MGGGKKKIKTNANQFSELKQVTILCLDMYEYFKVKVQGF